MNWQKWIASIVLNFILSLFVVKSRKIKKIPADLGVKFEKVNFQSRGSSIPLVGWLCPANNSKLCIVLVPGGVGNRTDPSIGMLEMTKRLVEAGYNVLLFDLRGHGESGGKWRCENLGNEYEDVFGAFDFLIRQGFLSQNIGILGFSLGAIAGLAAAAKDKRVKAVVAESGLANIESLFENKPFLPNFKKNSSEPNEWITKPIAKVLKWCVVKSGVKIPNLPELLPQSSAKFFLIHGKNDRAIPFGQSRKLFKIIGGMGKGHNLWLIDNVSHCRSFRENPELYILTVTSFFKRQLC